MQTPRILALFGSRVMLGAERENAQVLATLKEQGCEVLCLVRHEDWNDHIPAALAEHGLACRKVPYLDGWLPGWRLWVLVRNPVALLVGNWRMLRVVREFRPTHIHAYGQFFVLNFIPAIMLSRLPLIYRAGDEPTRHRWFWRLSWRFLVRRAERFVAISRFIADTLVAAKVPPSRIEVIHGVPTRRAAIADSRPNVRSGARDIVFVGQIAEHKGPHVLVEAFDRLSGSYPDARLIVAGRISEADCDAWARRFRDRSLATPRLRERISFPGHVEDIPGLLRQCAVLVAPSLCNEALGLVVLEAKEAGIPAIVFPNGGLPEMIEHGVDGFVCKQQSAEALAEQLELYLADAALAKRHGTAARQSLERFSAAEFAKRWLAVYVSTLSVAASPHK